MPAVGRLLLFRPEIDELVIDFTVPVFATSSLEDFSADGHMLGLLLVTLRHDFQ